MSTQIIPFENAAPVALSDDARKAMDISGDVPEDTSRRFISLKGKQFSFKKEDGEMYYHPERYIDLVIVGISPKGSSNSRTFYAKGYDSGSTAPPDCASNDGISPAPSVESPQAAKCITCPQNVWGTDKDADGKPSKGKACKEGKILLVVAPDDLMGTVRSIRLPVTTLANLTAYSKTVAKRGFVIPQIVTRMSFDPSTEYQKLVFEPVGALDEEGCSQVVEVMNSDLVQSWIANPQVDVTPQEDDAPEPEPALPVKKTRKKAMSVKDVAEKYRR